MPAEDTGLFKFVLKLIEKAVFNHLKDYLSSSDIYVTSNVIYPVV